MPFPVDIEFIKRTEEKLGVKFPPSFRLRMSKSNGGDARTSIGGWDEYWQLNPFFDTSDKTRLKRTCNDIVRETKSANDWPDFPPEAVAIGANGGGDLLILLPDSDDPSRLQDAVFWWDHETGEVEKIADDFDEIQ
jgi:hypothetical protein